MAQFMQIIEELDDCFAKTAGNILKYYVDEEEKLKVLTDLRNALKENCIETARIKAANDIKQRLEYVSEMEPQRSTREIVKEYTEAISDIQIDSSEDKRLIQYDRQIEDLLKATETTSNEDDADTDLQLTNRDINVIDPISKTRMTDPVRNTVCGHVYDRASLIAMLEKNKNTRCPVIGCTSKDYIVLSQCRTDIAMQIYLDKNPA
ncbi:E3 SUMO-protein ligase NSE2-like [Pseudomyrmex gracilis]|uniref:E3 SUMO-protein ligase NSE2-like n=1 Tax=Pseudomyrmex gracilis TaxID=219809 RepID=UPI000995240D|nr:E3 SUMO-protein ligase NSE2-like [Pseudomyrmex gracilis]